MTRFSSFWSVVLILWLVLTLQPIQVLHSQERGKYILSPQLKPVTDKTIEQSSYLPWMQSLTSNCENSDFSMGDWTNWQGCYGYFNNSCQFSGFKTTAPIHYM